jgi:predicted transcriptional regulator
MVVDIWTKQYINELTETILRTYHIVIPITDIEKVVTLLGGEIIEFDAFDDLYDGCIRRKFGGGFDLAVAKHQNAEERKFAIARRLGHLFLHMGYQISKNQWTGQDAAHFRPFTNYKACCQANEFAKALLMPKTAFIEVVKANTVDRIVNVEAVAKTFTVSEEMVKERAYSLGIATHEH